MPRICALDDVPEGQARGFDVDGRELVVVRRAGWFVYVNECPHQGTSLDWAPGRFLSSDGRHLQCATHGALFQVEDGLCITGPCRAQSLTPVVVEERDDGLWLAQA